MEAKMEIFQSLLQEIRDDVKNQPTKDQYLELKQRVDDLEECQDEIKESHSKLSVKVGALISSITVALTLSIQALIEFIKK